MTGIAKWMGCAAVVFAAAAGGCKSPKKAVTYVPPEPYPTLSDTPGTTETTGTYEAPSTPEPPVGPTTYGETTTTVADVSGTPAPPTGGSADVVAAGEGGDTGEGSLPRSYVVRKGDTLYSLARRFYNDQSKWRLIYEANRASLRDPNHIQVGQVLTIPEAK